MKKIALLTRTWSNNYFRDLMEGISIAVKGKDIRVEVFNAYDIGSSMLKSRNELKIHALPVASQYDALMIFVNSEVNETSLDDIIDEFVEAQKPIISIDRQIEGIPFIGIDNYASEYEIVEHLIKDHNCKTFQYVGGTEFFFDNTERFRAFKDCIEANGLTVDYRYVSHHHFMESDGADAFRLIMERDLPMPDAVVCANDNMAMGYCEAAEVDGFYAAEDYKLVGFDNISEAEIYYPSLSSINKDISKIAQTTVEMLLGAIEGIPIPKKTLMAGAIKYNQSCGCSKDRSVVKEYRKLISENKMRDWADVQQRESRNCLCACRTIEEFQEALHANYKQIGLYEAAVCIKDEILKNDELISDTCYSDHITCYSESSISRVFRLNSVFPKCFENREEQIFIYSSVYFDTDIFGYCVSVYNTEIFDKRYHGAFIDSISLTIENIRQKQLIDSMNQRFKELYVLDQMTGLYNRFGYSTMAGALFEKCKGNIYIEYIDLDNLKKINDTHGHDAGDLAINGTAECIKKVFGGDEIHVRMGGDEFLVMGAFVDEQILINKENELTKQLKEYSEAKKMPVVLEASMGHFFNTGEYTKDDLELILKRADSNMYAAKQKKKKEREE